MIAFAYHRAARGDAWAALVAAISDALADLEAAELRVARQARLISWGYARGQTGADTISMIACPDRPLHALSDPEIGEAIV
ncbi:hypothetical protein [Methylobacterium phyllostachyos]|uniref:hypothetical protein n=1 Tax=Methylobacterium phyllostachyos TaxID=582672 RepID=UPI003138A83B